MSLSFQYIVYIIYNKYYTEVYPVYSTHMTCTRLARIYICAQLLVIDVHSKLPVSGVPLLKGLCPLVH